MIGILDYGMGNINSVHNALEHLGYDSHILRQASDITDCSHLIIPGVGAYTQAMDNIDARQLRSAIIAHAQAGKPLLGICLGMQILSESGDEGGRRDGLGLIPGQIELLDLYEHQLPVPHVGWNDLQFNFEHPVCERLKKHVDFYFVHSYFFNTPQENVLASVQYGKQFPAMVAKNNVLGIQFHPEKSQDNGLLLIENFCEWDGQC